MSLVRFADIHKFLHEKDVFLSIFDLVRIVDPISGQLFEYEGNKITKTGGSCIDIFGNEERCLNCSSARAFHTGEQVVKFEHINDEVFLVISVPLDHNDEKIVVELIKNITRHSGEEIKSDSLRSEIMGFINNLNASASIDSLTGLKNRPFITSHLEGILSRHAKNSVDFSAVIIGFDSPSLDEKYGKVCAEFILASVGGIISSFIRSEFDIAARYEDESFLVCFSGIASEACEEVCGRLRDRIEGTVINYKGQPIHVTVSMGIASIGETASPEELLEIAKGKMEEARKKGRSSIVR